ncbi:MAG: hypothetical protein ACRDRD_17985 [Pseudonocardiaceae bacterium]
MTTVYQRPYAERDGSEFQEYEGLTVEYRDASHRYWLHHGEGRVAAVSVTSVLKVLDKPALLAWAEACGAAGAAQLAAAGELDGVLPSEAIDRVRLHKLGMDAKRDAGADRGTAVHNVLELWAREHEVPDLADFPAEVRGYVQGLCAWLLATRPQPSSMERFVGSVTHTYAGRLDLRATLDGRDCIVDLKTNPRGRVYDEAHLQSRAYALADVECGSEPPEGIVIVAVGEHGGFEMVECEAEAGDWLNVLGTYRSLSRLRSARSARERLAKAAA